MDRLLEAEVDLDPDRLDMVVVELPVRVEAVVEVEQQAKAAIGEIALEFVPHLDAAVHGVPVLLELLEVDAGHKVIEARHARLLAELRQREAELPAVLPPKVLQGGFAVNEPRGAAV